MISRFIKYKNRIAIVIVFLTLCDLSLFIFDQVVGEEPGVVFGYKILNLISISNAIVIALAIGIKFSSVVIKFVKNILLSTLGLFAKINSKNLLNAGISVVTVCFLLFLVELTFYFLLKSNETPYPFTYDYCEGNFFRSDSLLGWGAQQNTKAKYTKVWVDPVKHDTATVFKITYSSDSLGNRLIDIPGMNKRKKYSIFFGCSFTFGWGLEDTEAIPYYFAKTDTSFCSYNFAFGSYGPQNMLAKLQFTDLRREVKQEDGVCFYIFIDAHVARAVGDMNTYVNFISDFPYYDYQGDSLHYYGSFRNGRKLISSFYSIMSKSNFVKYYKINFPPRLKESHYKLASDVIYKSYQEYKRQFHNENFYVVLYPGNNTIAPYLKNYNIHVIDCSSLFPFGKDNETTQYKIPKDGHPSALANELLASHLKNVLANLNTH